VIHVERAPSRARALVASLFAAVVLSLSVAPVLLSPGLVSPARADDVDPTPAADDAAESRSATFQAVTGAQQEDVPGGPLLVAAYGAVLVLVLGYVLYLGSLTAGASRDLERLEKAIEARKPDFRKSARGDAMAAEVEGARRAASGDSAEDA
jgi:hypothetical protein